MKKILALALAIICVLAAITAGYVYLNSKHDRFIIAKNPKKGKVAVATNQSGKLPKKTEQDSKPLKTVIAHSDFSVIYTNLGQLVKDADIIVEGQVIGVSYFDRNTVTYTRVLLKATKSYTPNIKEGDILPFADLGGITTQAALIRYNDNKFNQPIGKAEENTKVQVLFDGAPLTKVGEHVLYFAKDETDFFKPEKYYGSIGAFQGKFTISGDSIERYAPKDMQSPRYSSLKMSKADFEQKLNDAIEANGK